VSSFKRIMTKAPIMVEWSRARMIAPELMHVK